MLFGDQQLNDRTSEMSAVGLLAAALQEIDIKEMLLGEATRNPVVKNNPTALLAMCWYWASDGVGSKESWRQSRVVGECNSCYIHISCCMSYIGVFSFKHPYIRFKKIHFSCKFHCMRAFTNHGDILNHPTILEP